MKKDFLIEIGTEELPPKLLIKLAQAFADGLEKKLKTENLDFSSIQFYATPRRLALLINQLNSKQPEREVERRGPALNAPTAAIEGFARSCNTTINKLEKLETAQGSWWIYRYHQAGKTVVELLPELINKTLSELPITKPMRWNNHETQFIRPVHWIVMLYGADIVAGEILGITADRKTYGHRFHHPEAIEIAQASDYNNNLKQIGHVIADFTERKNNIRHRIEAIAKEHGCEASIPEDLLDEVTGLVEWPIALFCQFDANFLKVPQEALIAAMETHQRCFAVKKADKLQPYFIAISNINSKDPKEVIRGNERVVRARLADAKFFYETDCKIKLTDRLEELKHVVFQAKLGSMYDKCQRIATLAKQFHSEHAYRAGLLCKTDLLSHMVGEFPELQGIMGYYYAKNDKENEEVAIAIRDHYKPRFAGDTLPETLTGCIVSLADRIDTIVNIFKIGQQPTGDKDPFGLRRAALGILRILIEKELDIDIRQLTDDTTHKFILERLPNLYAEKDIAPDTLEAVLRAEKNAIPLDIHRRVIALQTFRLLPAAKTLIEANKRARNILLQIKQIKIPETVNPALLTTAIEKKFYEAVTIKPAEDYAKFLTQLANTQPIVSQFFDEVMVMDENVELRDNRLALLNNLRQLFLRVADISLLQN